MDAERLTAKAASQVEAAQKRALAAGAAQFQPEHLVAVLAKDEKLGRFMPGKREVRRALAVAAVMEPDNPDGRPMSERTVRVLEYAQGLADAIGDPMVTSEHLVYGLACEGFATESSGAILALMSRQREQLRQRPVPPRNPLQDLAIGDLVNMESRLHERVIGQKKAVVVVSEAVRRQVAGLSDPRQPFGSFMFLGPTGVGKTELAKSLAAFLFGSENRMVRFDMSEYREQHTMSKLFGAPPGYVGFAGGGQLTNAVRENPYSVVLFDEIEKAHPDVHNVLLQLLDDARMTDGQGHLVDFHNTVVVMTSNVGSRHWQETGLDRKGREEAVFKELWQEFRPEFLNRLDEIVIFDALSRSDCDAILKLVLRPVRDRLMSKGIALDFTLEAHEFLLEQGFNPILGARALRRTVKREVENPLATAIIRDGLTGDVTAVPDDGRLKFEQRG